MKRKTAFAAVAVLKTFALMSLAGCGGNAGSKTTAGPVVLRGAGATAPNLAYSKWVTEFNKEEPSIRVEYHAIGSGEGLRQLQDGALDFAASDIPLSDEQIAKLKVKPLHFPTLVSAIVPVYNVPKAGVLNFTGSALAGIYLGKITTWNHPELVKANPGVALPASRIVVLHRSDASGSTYAFTDFLAKVASRGRKPSAKARPRGGLSDKVRRVTTRWRNW